MVMVKDRGMAMVKVRGKGRVMVKGIVMVKVRVRVRVKVRRKGRVKVRVKGKGKGKGIVMVKVMVKVRRKGRVKVRVRVKGVDMESLNNIKDSYECEYEYFNKGKHCICAKKATHKYGKIYVCKEHADYVRGVVGNKRKELVELEE